jgi:hypothetical protein
MTGEFDLSLITLLLLAVAALILAVAAIKKLRKKPTKPPSRPTPNEVSLNSYRLVRRSEPRAPADGGNSNGIRVLAVHRPTPSAPLRPRRVDAVAAAAPAPGHAVCTWCGDSMLNGLEARGGAVRCEHCGYFSHRDCYEKAGSQCGGICRL